MMWNKSNHLNYARTRKRFIIAKTRQGFDIVLAVKELLERKN